MSSLQQPADLPPSDLIAIQEDILIYILRDFLDLPDLWTLTRVSRQLRYLSHDVMRRTWRFDVAVTTQQQQGENMNLFKVQCRYALIALGSSGLFQTIPTSFSSLTTIPSPITPSITSTSTSTTSPSPTPTSKLSAQPTPRETALQQAIIRGVASHKHQFVLLEDIDVRNRIRVAVDLVFHHAVFVAPEPDAAAVHVRLLSAMDAAFPSHSAEISYTLADNLKAFLEYSGYQLLFLHGDGRGANKRARQNSAGAAVPFRGQYDTARITRSRLAARRRARTLRTIEMCFAVVGHGFSAKLLTEAQVEPAVRKMLEVLKEDGTRGEDEPKEEEEEDVVLCKWAALDTLLKEHLNKRDPPPAEVCALVKGELERIAGRG
ncbi:hypothetical protein BC936DRAFT_144197 [Jimgerdemannia flammicorona]|uniref:Uncharacterized protein n=2 Tax=Jimgerdemannia flammicorona TaxID=994334 RepID=A0A432ZY10_9FUNG|nr:hypothetical protein BC936DRAFT_144197 [Jimgerdemannia flammicorona]RUS12909.1 hypothetical protein BC938DRAFT_478297 [Jimgerdemannia flammicorona]